jgi:hypothetical protein
MAFISGSYSRGNSMDPECKEPMFVCCLRRYVAGDSLQGEVTHCLVRCVKNNGANARHDSHDHRHQKPFASGIEWQLAFQKG